MPRVAGCDPGTSSLDLLAIDDERVVAQDRIEPDALRADPTIPVQWLRHHGPFPHRALMKQLEEAARAAIA